MGMIDRASLVCIGRIQTPHGLDGTLRLYVLTDTPEYYTDVRQVYLATSERLREYGLRALAPLGQGWSIALEGVTDRETAMTLRGAEVLLPSEMIRPLEPGEYFTDDLIGCTVEDMNGQPLGTVRGVMETGANDVLELEHPEGTVLVPLTDEVLREIDTEARRIRIEPLPGLLELNRPSGAKQAEGATEKKGGRRRGGKQARREAP